MGARPSVPVEADDLVLQIQLIPTRIVTTAAPVQIIYSLSTHLADVQTVSKSKKQKKLLCFHRGECNTIPFAKLRGNKLEIGDAENETWQVFKTDKFLYRKRWVGEPKHFKVAGREYKLKAIGASVLILPAGFKIGQVQPIALFTRRSSSFNEPLRNTIRLPAAYIKAKHDAAGDTDGTVVDGRPTPLLDHILVAEILWQRERARHGELVQGINLWTDAGQWWIYACRIRRATMGAHPSIPVEDGDVVLHIQINQMRQLSRIVTTVAPIQEVYSLSIQPGQSFLGLFDRKKTLRFHRGGGNVDDDSLEMPYASLKGTMLEIRNTKDGTGQVYKTGDYLYRTGWTGEYVAQIAEKMAPLIKCIHRPNRFMVAGREYKLKSQGPSVLVLPAGAKKGQARPIAIFTRISKSFKQPTHNTVHLPAAYVKTKMDMPDKDATLIDGQPTALLDHIMIAEMLWQRERSRCGEMVQGIGIWTDVGHVPIRKSQRNGDSSGGGSGSSSDGGGSDGGGCGGE